MLLPAPQHAPTLIERVHASHAGGSEWISLDTATEIAWPFAYTNCCVHGGQQTALSPRVGRPLSHPHPPHTHDPHIRSYAVPAKVQLPPPLAPSSQVTHGGFSQGTLARVHPSSWAPMKHERRAEHRRRLGLQSTSGLPHHATFWRGEPPGHAVACDTTSGARHRPELLGRLQMIDSHATLFACAAQICAGQTNLYLFYLRAQKYAAPVAGNVPTNVRQNGEQWGKMRGNGTQIQFLQISPSFLRFYPSLCVSPHFSPFSPIFPNFSLPWVQGGPIFPPLVAMLLCLLANPHPQPVKQTWFFLRVSHHVSPIFPHKSQKISPQPPLPPISAHFPPISPHFPRFFLGSFRQCTPPPPALLPTETLFLVFSAPKFPIFPPNNLFFPHLPPFTPIFPTLAHFPDSVPLNVPKVDTSEPCYLLLQLLPHKKNTHGYSPTAIGYPPTAVGYPQPACQENKKKILDPYGRPWVLRSVYRAVSHNPGGPRTLWQWPSCLAVSREMDSG